MLKTLWRTVVSTHSSLMHLQNTTELLEHPKVVVNFDLKPLDSTLRINSYFCTRPFHSAILCILPLFEKCQTKLHMAMYRHMNQREIQLNSRASSRRDTCFLFNFFSLCSCLLYCPSPLFLQLVFHISLLLLLLYFTWFPPLSASSIVEPLQKERATLD